MTQATRLVATFIAAPKNARLGDEQLAHVRALLPEASAPDWLDRDLAADISFAAEAGTGPRAWADILRDDVHGEFDVVVQPPAHRRKMLLVADMDSTIIGCECIDELADFAGRKAEISAITERAMHGELDFEAALTERVATTIFQRRGAAGTTAGGSGAGGVRHPPLRTTSPHACIRSK